jgi:hypothetical protein
VWKQKRCRKEENVMASNFRISVHRDSNSLELKLAGDFDGTSACELLNVLKDNCDGGVNKVAVNTSSLKDIYPFGRDTFQRNLYTLKGKGIRLAFTGKKAKSIAPERSESF